MMTDNPQATIIIDENEKTVWSGTADIIRGSETYPDSTGVNYLDEEDTWGDLGDISSDDLIIVKAPTHGTYKVKAMYNADICWMSDFEDF